MNVYKISICIILIIASTVLFTSCEYDVAPAQWDENGGDPLPPSPTIAQITPAAATPGVNTITIQGTGFVGSKAVDHVFFDNNEVDTTDIVSISTTEIIVRRPNLISDTCTIKVESESAGLVVKFKPYKIDPVIEEYGSFNDNFPLSMVAVDDAENVYVLDRQTISANETHNHLTKITSSGVVTKDTLINGVVADTVKIVGNLIVDPVDGIIRDGKLYLPGTATNLKKDIVVVDLATRKWTVWRRVIGNKALRFCDFDVNGYFYVSGIKNTDLYIVRPDSSSVASTLYTGANTEILALRVFNNYLYVAANLNSGEKGIWRHLIGANGSLGAGELYLDWAKVDTTFNRRTIKNIGMSSDGVMYIGTGDINPLLVVVDHNTNKVDYFYKNILLPYDAHFVWGNGNFLYYISGSTTSTPIQPFKLYRVDMGVTGAAK